jgi:hypothetical protein
MTLSDKYLCMDVDLWKTKTERGLIKSPRKDVQLSFRVDAAFATRVDAAADDEDLAPADFIRKLAKWALSAYDTIGSLHALRAMELAPSRASLIESAAETDRRVQKKRRSITGGHTQNKQV